MPREDSVEEKATNSDTLQAVAECDFILPISKQWHSTQHAEWCLTVCSLAFHAVVSATASILIFHSAFVQGRTTSALT